MRILQLNLNTFLVSLSFFAFKIPDWNRIYSYTDCSNNRMLIYSFKTGAANWDNNNVLA